MQQRYPERLTNDLQGLAPADLTRTVVQYKKEYAEESDDKAYRPTAAAHFWGVLLDGKEDSDPPVAVGACACRARPPAEVPGCVSTVGPGAAVTGTRQPDSHILTLAAVAMAPALQVYLNDYVAVDIGDDGPNSVAQVGLGCPPCLPPSNSLASCLVCLMGLPFARHV